MLALSFLAPVASKRSRPVAASLAALVVAAVMPVISAPSAVAATAAVTPTTTTEASSRTGTATTLAGMTVAEPDPAQRLQVEVSTTLGTLTLPTRTGLTLGFGNAWSGTSSVSFSGLEGSVNAALADARLVGSGTPGTAAVSITSMHQDEDYVYSAPNQHFYEYVPAPGITFTSARSAALSRSYKGQQGYLATMPSQQLNDFVSGRIQGAQNVWFGAEALANPAAGIARRWIWADGPLKGQAFTECSNAAGSCSVVNADGRYSSWATGEPNNSNGETAPVTNWSGTIGRWNDLAPTNTGNIGGYVVEYGDRTQGTVAPFTDFYRAASTVALADVPATPAQPGVQPGDRRLTATLVAPADRGSALTEYVVTATPVGGGEATTATCPATATTCTVTDLQNGLAHDVTVVARNDRGASAASPATRSTPATVPDAPTGVSATSLDGSASVRFTAPAWNGGAAVTDYRVYPQPATSSPHVSCSGEPCVVDGLTNGTGYTFTVRAVSSAGLSEPSAASEAVTPAGPPSSPTDARVEHGDSSATVHFGAPSATNGSPVTSYTVRVTPAGGGTSITVSCTDSPCTVEGLTNGTTYDVTVSAVSTGGTSAAQSAGSVTPATVPEAVGAVTATRADRSIELTFAAPASDGGSSITGYQYTLDGGETWQDLPTTEDPSGRAGTVPGLSNGTSYTVAVRALNAEGASTPTTAGAPTVPATVPDAPAVGEVAPGDGAVTVSFTTPVSNGAAISSYTVTAQPGGSSTTCSTSPCEVTGLVNGSSYRFSVVATNDVGDSAGSALSSEVVPFSVPGAVTDLSTTSQDGSALVDFTPPTSDGGRPVTGYVVSVDGGGWTMLTTGVVDGGRLQAQVDGLSNGTTHSLRVAAVNLAGRGSPSKAADVVPAGPPSAPRDVVAALHGVSATLSWSAPDQDGGAPVTGYLVTSLPDGLTCTAVAPERSCTISGLTVGTGYTFSVVALNGAAALPGTGPGEESWSGTSLVTATPGAPAVARGSAGDRSLTLRWRAPSNPGTSVTEGYQVSLDAGRTWRTVTTTGTEELTATVTGVRNGRRYRVRVRAVNADGPGAAFALQVDEYHWFADPLTPARRARLLDVPTSPDRYRGAVRRTTAWASSSGGSPAMALNRVRGRQLQAGDAATLFDRRMFRFARPTLTDFGRQQLRALVRSLRYVDAVRCEGHVDYSDRSGRRHSRRAAVLSEKRAAMACRVLVGYGAEVRTTARGFADREPAVVGGRGHRDRWANRRVVVAVTKG